MFTTQKNVLTVMLADMDGLMNISLGRVAPPMTTSLSNAVVIFLLKMLHAYDPFAAY